MKIESVYGEMRTAIGVMSALLVKMMAQSDSNSSFDFDSSELGEEVKEKC